MSTVTQPASAGENLASSCSLTGSPASSSQEEKLDVGGSPHPLAVRSDGAVLLSVEECRGIDLKGRTLWTAVVLRPDEAAYVHQRGVNAAHEAAAMILGKLPREKKKEGGTS